jgi:DNA polymerase III alpha subunit
VFPESFARLETILKTGTSLLMKARVQVEEAGTRLSLLEARRLEEITKRTGSAEFRLRLEMRALTEDTLDALEQAFAGSPGTISVVFELRSPDGSVALLQAEQGVTVSREFVEAVRRICGEQAIEAVTE